MVTYISLMKLTDQGIKSIKEAPQRIEAALKGLEAMGGKLLSLYIVMGEYDYVGIAEAPTDEVAMAYLLALGADGNVRTTSFKAFSKETLAEVIKRLP